MGNFVSSQKMGKVAAHDENNNGLALPAEASKARSQVKKKAWKTRGQTKKNRAGGTGGVTTSEVASRAAHSPVPRAIETMTIRAWMLLCAPKSASEAIKLQPPGRKRGLKICTRHGTSAMRICWHSRKSMVTLVCLPVRNTLGWQIGFTCKRIVTNRVLIAAPN